MYKLLITAILILSIFQSKAQTPSYPDIYYKYDAAGNFTDRSITVFRASKSLPEFLDTLPELTEVKENNLIEQTKVYPVPTQAILNIDFINVNTFSGSTIFLYNSNGSIVYQTKQVNSTNSIDLSTMSTGSYYLKIIIEKQSKVWIIIKQ